MEIDYTGKVTFKKESSSEGQGRVEFSNKGFDHGDRLKAKDRGPKQIQLLNYNGNKSQENRGLKTFVKTSKQSTSDYEAMDNKDNEYEVMNDNDVEYEVMDADTKSNR